MQSERITTREVKEIRTCRDGDLRFRSSGSKSQKKERRKDKKERREEEETITECVCVCMCGVESDKVFQFEIREGEGKRISSVYVTHIQTSRVSAKHAGEVQLLHLLLQPAGKAWVHA